MGNVGGFLNSRPVRRLRRWTRITFTSLIALLVLLLIVAVVFAGNQISRAGETLKAVPALTDPSKAPLPGPISYYSADGELLGRRGVERRVVLSPAQIPELVSKATVAIEDQRFYQHNGVDLQGALRAAWVDIKARSMVQGGSTITMQYVRNVYLNFQKTANRKLSEIALALQLEGVWTKQRILTAYLNTVYYGQGAYGIEAAARTYFGVSASELSLPQAALLSGIVQNPTALDPRTNRDAALERRNRVLDEMYNQGMISLPELRSAKNTKIKLRKLKGSERPSEPALMELLRRQSRTYLSRDRLREGGLKVYGTFSMKDIRRARTALRAVYGGRSSSPVVSSAWVHSRSGRVLLLANSTSPSKDFDFSWQARRQPGSTVKAFTAATILENGGSLSDSVDNRPVKVQNGSRNYTISPTQGGVANIFDALRFSQNPASWRLYQRAGPQRVLALEKNFGLEGMDSNSAAALGGVKVGTNPMELAGAFSVFASNGRRAPVHAIWKAEDRIGNPIWTDARLRPRQLFPNEYARQMNVALKRVVNEGFPQLKKSLSISRSRQVAGKTGTTEKNGDAWFSGYVPQMTGAVWTGYARSTRPLTDSQGATVWGSTVPARVWNRLAYQMLRGKPALKFLPPRGVQRVPAVKGKDKDYAIAKLRRFGFRSVTPRSEFSRTASPDTVLSQNPPAGSWVKPSNSILLSFATDSRPAPDLSGQSFLDAERELGSFAKLKLSFKVSSSPLGQVISQEPLAGFPLRYGEVMKVVVATRPGPVRRVIKKVPYVPSGSELADLRRRLEEAQNRPPPSGETQLVVPNVVGLSPEQASLVLSSIGLSSRISGSGAEVSSQSPQGGSLAAASQTVRLKTQ